MPDIILNPEQQHEANLAKIKRANEKIMTVLKEEGLSFHVEMVPKINLVPNDKTS